MSEALKIAHLGFIQGALNRMANNSFLIKGWAVTLIAAIFALSFDKYNQFFLCIAFAPLLVFWSLDAYFMRQELLFRTLYNDAAMATDATPGLSMSTKRFTGQVGGVPRMLVSKTLILFYGPLFIVVLAAAAYRLVEHHAAQPRPRASASVSAKRPSATPILPASASRPITPKVAGSFSGKPIEPGHPESSGP